MSKHVSLGAGMCAYELRTGTFPSCNVLVSKVEAKNTRAYHLMIVLYIHIGSLWEIDCICILPHIYVKPLSHRAYDHQCFMIAAPIVHGNRSLIEEVAQLVVQLVVPPIVRHQYRWCHDWSCLSSSPIVNNRTSATILQS